MENEENNDLMNRDLVLDKTTLNVTLKELVHRKENRLAGEIKRILEHNQVQKPNATEGSPLLSPSFYTIDLSADDIKQIVYIFLELEEDYLGDDGENTPTANFYATIIDKWNELM